MAWSFQGLLLEDYSRYNFEKYQTICAARLSDLEKDAEEHDVTIKRKLYSAVILDNKTKIVNILRNEYDVDSVLTAERLMFNLRQYLMQLSDEIILVTESFEENVVDKINRNRANPQELLDLQVFIKSILNEKNEPNLRDIGKNQELKKKYITLAVS